MSSGITERCNRLESCQLGSAQVELAAGLLAVSLPTTAHGNTIHQQTNNPKRSPYLALGGKEIIGLVSQRLHTGIFAHWFIMELK